MNHDMVLKLRNVAVTATTAQPPKNTTNQTPNLPKIGKKYNKIASAWLSATDFPLHVRRAAPTDHKVLK